jgi:hypothetical protein
MAKTTATKTTSTTLWTVKQLGQHFEAVANTSHKALKECWEQAHNIYLSVGADKDKQQTVKAAIAEVYTRAFTDGGEYFGMDKKSLANKLRKVCGLLADSKKPDAVRIAKARGSKGKGNKVTKVKKPTGGIATSRTATSLADKGATFRPSHWREDIEPALQLLALAVSPCAKSEVKQQKDFAQATVIYLKTIMKINNTK